MIAILTCFLIAQVAMGDMPNDRDERIATLQTWFHVNTPDGPVGEEGIQGFLDELKEIQVPETETRYQKPKAKSQKPETRNQNPEASNQKPENINQKQDPTAKIMNHDR